MRIGTRTFRTRGALGATSAVAALVLVGCTMGTPDLTVTSVEPIVTEAEMSAQSGAAASNNPASDEDSGEDESALSGVQVSPERAVQLAMASFPGSELLGLDLERNRGVTAWEVKIADGQNQSEVYVDAVTGEIVGSEDEGAVKAKHLHRMEADHVGYQKAMRLMRQEAGGGEIVELELDDEDGRIVWEGEVVTPGHGKCKVVLDADTGAMIERKHCQQAGQQTRQQTGTHHNDSNHSNRQGNMGSNSGHRGSGHNGTGHRGS